MNPTEPFSMNRNYTRHWQRSNEGNVSCIHPPPRPVPPTIPAIVPNTGTGPFVRPRRPTPRAHFYPNPNTARPPPAVEFTRDPIRPIPIWMQRGHDWGSEMSRSDVERHIHKEHMEKLSKDGKMKTTQAIPSGKLPMEFGLERISKENTAALGRRDILAGQSGRMPTLSGGMPNNFKCVVDVAPITANAAQFVPGYKGEVYVPLSENARHWR